MKYIIRNDVSYIFTNKRLLFVLYFVAISFVSMLYTMSGMDTNSSLSIILGNNYKVNESLYIELIMYIFNISIAVYLCFLLFIKDIRYNLDNIFLRVNPKNWIINKNLIFLIIMAFFKVFEYLLIMIIFFVNNKNIDLCYMIFIMFKDYIYHLVVQYFLLFGYVVIELLKRMKLLFIVLCLLLIIIFPKNILNSNLLFLVMLLVVIIISIAIIFINYSKLIIEKVRRV